MDANASQSLLSLLLSSSRRLATANEDGQSVNSSASSAPNQDPSIQFMHALLSGQLQQPLAGEQSASVSPFTLISSPVPSTAASVEEPLPFQLIPSTAVVGAAAEALSASMQLREKLQEASANDTDFAENRCAF